MDRKIAALLLVCVVALAVIYSCVGVVLSAQVDGFKEREPSGNTVGPSITRLSLKTSGLKPHQCGAGDPIDDPKPNK